MRGPIFHGQPSPSIKKMMQMTPGELREHLKRMEQERAFLADRLQQQPPATSGNARDPRVGLERRLARLIEKGQEILAAKHGNRRVPGTYA